MNLHAKMGFASAVRRLELATCLLEDAANGGHASMIGDAYAQVLHARGDLAAAIQIMQLEEDIAKADGPTARAFPPLRIVGR
jgi:hypothetical protein